MSVPSHAQDDSDGSGEVEDESPAEMSVPSHAQDDSDDSDEVEDESTEMYAPWHDSDDSGDVEDESPGIVEVKQPSTFIRVNCQGNEVYLDLLNLPTSKRYPGKIRAFQRETTVNGQEYTFMLGYKNRHYSDVELILVDGKTQLNTIIENCYESIILLHVINEGMEPIPVWQHFMKSLEKSVKHLTYLEWKMDPMEFKTTSRDFKVNRYQDNVIQLQKILESKIVDLFHKRESRNYKQFLQTTPKYRLPNNLTLTDYGRGSNRYFDNFVLCLMLILKSFNCAWWITTFYPVSSDPIAIESFACASELKHSIPNDKGYLHSLYFTNQDCNSVTQVISQFTSASACIRSLIIEDCHGTLSFEFLSSMEEGLDNLIVTGTKTNLDSLVFPTQIVSMLKVLVLRDCNQQTEKVPSIIGNLRSLEFLDLRCNHFKRLPLSFSNLDQLRYLHVENDEMLSPPLRILKGSAQGVVQYFKELEVNKSIANREAKVMVVGQEGVGKSTLVQSMKQHFPLLFDTISPGKTFGIEISTLKVRSSVIKVYDLAGDVEYLNTHTLFFSPNCLHLAVFDLSNITVSKESRPTDQFCRLELWLQTIASQQPNSYAIIVGTHRDHPMLSSRLRTVIRKTLFNVLMKHRKQHVRSLSAHKECMVCVPERFPKKGSFQQTDTEPEAQSHSTCGSIPHILKYIEVSGTTNKNISCLKNEIHATTTGIKTATKTDKIPERWLQIRQSFAARWSTLSKSATQIAQLPLLAIAGSPQSPAPILLIEEAKNMAHDSGIVKKESFETMLRFFHSQGDFLWYEDIPELQDVVILDPQWLANQLKIIISHLPKVNAICKGVLEHSHLSQIWPFMSEENQLRFLALFRRVGLCFSINEREDLFPCSLPIGWPNSDMWPLNPENGENQTSFLVKFSFVPVSFFPDLIIAINKKKDSFPPNVKPLYYRFHAVYITKPQDQCHLHYEGEEYFEQASGAACSEEDKLLYNRVHMEMMPYTNSLKVTVRGPYPCCQVSDIRSMIKKVQSERFPGITYSERLICPTCVFKKKRKPSTFDFKEATKGYCPKGHNVCSIDNLLSGKMHAHDWPLNIEELVETLKDTDCPKLFVVLPINNQSLPLRRRLVYSLLRDGYAVHLLCECPEQCHFVSSPGFRIGKPKEFFSKHGRRVCKLLHVLSVLGLPFTIASALDPTCRPLGVVPRAADSMSREMQSLLDDYRKTYPNLKTSCDDDVNVDLTDLMEEASGPTRSELSQLLHAETEGRKFDTLTCTYVQRYNKWLWLCKEHHQQYNTIKEQ